MPVLVLVLVPSADSTSSTRDPPANIAISLIGFHSRATAHDLGTPWAASLGPNAPLNGLFGLLAPRRAVCVPTVTTAEPVHGVDRSRRSVLSLLLVPRHGLPRADWKPVLMMAPLEFFC